MKDIARDLGLSIVTVSKVLRDHPDISEETRKRVLRRMRELNYRPNIAARSLSSGRTWTLGLVLPTLVHPFFAQIAKQISSEVRKQGYSLFISSSDEDPDLEIQEIEHLLSRDVDVMLIASTQGTVESFRRIEELRIPYILLDRQFPGLQANFVGVDDSLVGVLATTHLVEQGCQRIAHIRGPDLSTAIGRLEGYKQALASFRMTALPGHIVSIGAFGDNQGEQKGYEAAVSLLGNEPRPDGIFCFNDLVALGAMRAILDAGLRIPQDIAVVGCGNLLHSDFLRVPLSSVDQGSKDIGTRAAAMALHLAQNESETRSKKELVRPELVVRASSLRRSDH